MIRSSGTESSMEERRGRPYNWLKISIHCKQNQLEQMHVLSQTQDSNLSCLVSESDTNGLKWGSLCSKIIKLEAVLDIISIKPQVLQNNMCFV